MIAKLAPATFRPQRSRYQGRQQYRHSKCLLIRKYERCPLAFVEGRRLPLQAGDLSGGPPTHERDLHGGRMVRERPRAQQKGGRRFRLDIS